MRCPMTIVDPSLSKMWFDRGTAPLVGRPDSYAGAGIRVVECEFPVLVVGLSHKSTGKEMLLRVHADDYNYLPPRGWWVDENGDPLQANRVPSGNGFQPPPNPCKEDRGWLCFPGWREYHDHQSHQDNPWGPLRGKKEYGISATIMQLWHDLNGGGVTVP